MAVVTTPSVAAVPITSIGSPVIASYSGTVVPTPTTAAVSFSSISPPPYLTADRPVVPAPTITPFVLPAGAQRGIPLVR